MQEKINATITGCRKNLLPAKSAGNHVLSNSPLDFGLRLIG